MRVLFERPDLRKLNEDHTVVDMHLHTRYSDGINTVSSIAKKARQLGIGVAITDHNEIKGAIEIDKYKGILTIPGIEATSKEGSHLLIYFYDTASLKEFYKHHIKPFIGNDLMTPLDLKMEELIKRGKQYKSLVILPHPYSVSYVGVCNANFSQDRLNKIFSMVDGAEAINSENLARWNRKSTILAFNMNKSITGGSDGHTLFHMGKTVSYAKCKSNRKAFLDAVKKGKNKVIGKEIDIVRKITANGLKLKKTLKNYPDIIEKNIKFNIARLNSKRKILSRKLHINNISLRKDK